MSDSLKVGGLASRTGLTVRTLHHYDAIGLLVPSRRTRSGHRLYDIREISRLQQIRSLRQLGFSLEEIGAFLDRPDVSPRQVIRMHLQRLRQRIDHQQRLIERLERVAESLESNQEPSAEQFLQSIEAMTMFEKYYTPEQLEALEQRKEQVGAARIQAVQAQWEELYEQARMEMEKGTDPADEAAQALVRKSRALIEEFTGGDPGILASLTRMRQEEPSVRRQWGPPPEVAEFLRKAGEAQSRPSEDPTGQV